MLFLCYGNTCRSPAAEYLAKNLAENKYEKDLFDVEFVSAGLINAFGYAQPETVRFAKSRGINMSNFIPQLIDYYLLELNDLILTMEQTQVNKILQHFTKIPNLKAKVFTLKGFAGETKDVDIPDPYMTTTAYYNKTLEEIEKFVELSLKKIIELNKNYT